MEHVLSKTRDSELQRDPCILFHKHKMLVCSRERRELGGSEVGAQSRLGRALDSTSSGLYQGINSDCSKVEKWKRNIRTRFTISSLPVFWERRTHQMILISLQSSSY
ncbi:uncharacterized protein LOC122544068 isoform X2 [Chiloscyllium plagiosum]|uniref:uncharacterized protein LOC122544068 isoform X2 n=1 Tax=Chiloscyllium plagiosum TaxID=36176 RepID=UPI001CB7B44F|nr:uncharacterized protein LOC122544068 isoform X2 [Chiloscyllium plagiosum]